MTTAPAQTRMTVAFGAGMTHPLTVTYVLGVTNAPAEYDAFGTLTLYDCGSPARERQRYVLIREEHEAYHQGRYASGLYSYAPSDALDTSDVADRLYRAMVATLAPETR